MKQCFYVLLFSREQFNAAFSVRLMADLKRVCVDLLEDQLCVCVCVRRCSVSVVFTAAVEALFCPQLSSLSAWIYITNTLYHSECYADS